MAQGVGYGHSLNIVEEGFKHTHEWLQVLVHATSAVLFAKELSTCEGQCFWKVINWQVDIARGSRREVEPAPKSQSAVLRLFLPVFFGDC